MVDPAWRAATWGIEKQKGSCPEAGVVKLADTQGLGPCARKGVGVQLLSAAQKGSVGLH